MSKIEAFVGGSILQRREILRSKLLEQSTDASVVLVAPTQVAARSLLSQLAQERGSLFGWEASSFSGLFSRAAIRTLARRGLVLAGALAREAVMSRVLRTGNREQFGPLTQVIDEPGLARALCRTFSELEAACTSSEQVETLLSERASHLRDAWVAFQRNLREAKIATRDEVSRSGLEALRRREVQWVWWEPLPRTVVEEQVLRTLLSERGGLVFLPEDDALVADVDGVVERISAPPHPLSQSFRQRRGSSFPQAMTESNDTLPSHSVARPGPVLPEVGYRKCGNESEECLDVARTCLALAREGLRFGEIAVVLRDPQSYRSLLAQAFARAQIPFRFSRGIPVPDASGRAFLALLDCRLRSYSARAFSEYLAFGVAPALGDLAAQREFYAVADAELMPYLREDIERKRAEIPTFEEGAVEWQDMLIDAAVVGGIERWSRRLDLLREGFEQERDRHPEESSEWHAMERRLAVLARLRDFALPLLQSMSSFEEPALWGDWLARLEGLATRAVMDPSRVLQVLAELHPLAPVGPVPLTEVREVLVERLRDDLAQPELEGEGVFVLTPEEVRGRIFEVVLLPGLHEGGFPARFRQDPLLSDAVREQLRQEGAQILSRAAHFENERKLFRYAREAAARRLIGFCSMAEASRGRSRIAGTFACALEGTATDVANEETRTRWQRSNVRAPFGRSPNAAVWRVPTDANAAVDAAEFDLYALAKLNEHPTAGAAAYLLQNETFAVALRAQVSRLPHRKVDAYDGLFLQGDPSLVRFRTSERRYSASALQRFAACPLQFAYATLLRLQPRVEPLPVDVPDALIRGSFIHDVLFDLAQRLRERRLWPLRHPQELSAARQELEVVLSSVGEEYAERIVPAIPKVWSDFLEHTRRDVLVILQRFSEDPAWSPAYFELSFGLNSRGRGDPASTDEEVVLNLTSGRGSAVLRMRGSIDLVEESDRELRVTDYKTGSVKRVAGDFRLDGGATLQPVLYSLVLRELRSRLGLAEKPVIGGRLYFCSSRADFQDRFAALDERAEAAVVDFAHHFNQFIDAGVFPAAPIDERACQYCDYRAICGENEWQHSQKKMPYAKPLKMLRSLP